MNLKQGLEDNVEDDLRECRNQKCKRRGILVLRPAGHRFCSECGSRLKPLSAWKRINMTDTPLIDASPDPAPKGQAELALPIKEMPIVPTQEEWLKVRENTYQGYYELLESLDIYTWKDFQGTMDEYKEYCAECGIGTGKPVTPKLPAERFLRKPYKGNIVPFVRKADDTFTCDPDMITNPKDRKGGCPIVAQPVVEIPNIMFCQWKHLAGVFSTEWIAYLKGSLRATDGVWVIDSMYFPKQKANGAHVDAEDGECLPGTIGSVHSHVNMQAFFSTEDVQHFNHTIEMVVNRSGDVMAVVRTELECGRFSRVVAKVMLYGLADEQALVDDLKAKLTEQTHTTYTGQNYHRAHSKSCVCVDCCNARRSSTPTETEKMWDKINHYDGTYYAD